MTSSLREGIRHHWFSARAAAVERSNGILFVLRKLPLVGKKIPDQVYSWYGMKKVLYGLSFFSNLVQKLLAKFFWLLVYLILGILIREDLGNILSRLSKLSPGDYAYGYLGWWLVVGIGMAANMGFIDSLELDCLNFMQNYRISRKGYLDAKVIMGLLPNLVFYLFPWLIYSHLAKQPLYMAAAITTYAGSYLISAGLSRRSLRGKQKSNLNFFLRVGLLLASMGLFYATKGWPEFVQGPKIIWITLGAGLCLLLLGLIMYTRMGYRKEDYIQLVENSLVLQGQMTEALNSKDVMEGTALSQKMEVNPSAGFSQLKGGAYLNALLFDRFKKVFYKKLRNRILMVLGAASLGAIALKGFGVKPATESEFLKLAFVPFWIMSSSPIGRTIVQVCFVNCDLAMLNYPFYRESDTILGGFWYRFKRALSFNLLFATAFYSAFILLALVNGGISAKAYLAYGLFILALATLFAFHDLFLYYILQPFTQDMKVINPLYGIISGLLYWIGYAIFRSNVSSYWIMGIFPIFTLVYVVVGTFILKMKAPTTFRLKKE